MNDYEIYRKGVILQASYAACESDRVRQKVFDDFDRDLEQAGSWSEELENRWKELVGRV